jgi:hypothetical protein
MYAADIGFSFTNLLGNVVSVAVKVVIFLLIMALGWIVARWIRSALGRLLHRVGFDRAAHRGGLDRLLGNYSASDITAQVVMYAFLLFVLQLAFGIFGTNSVSDLISRLIAWLPRLFAAVIIVVVAAAIAGWARQVITGAIGGLSYGRALATAAQAGVLLLGIFAALGQIGVATSVIGPVLWTILATIAGIAIVGLGGGLIKPMQHRWERILNRAESETSAAADHVRANRGARPQDRDVNQPAAFGQPAYPSDRGDYVKPPADARGSYASPPADARGDGEQQTRPLPTGSDEE